MAIVLEWAMRWEVRGTRYEIFPLPLPPESRVVTLFSGNWGMLQLKFPNKPNVTTYTSINKVEIFGFKEL